MVPQGGFAKTSSRKARFAIITPYYKEEQGILERCVQSVRRQTVPADHFLMSDGFPQDWLDGTDVRHIRLGRAHNDCGNTPRGIGALLAVSEGYSGIGLLDADNWYDANHIEECCKAANTDAEHPTDLVFSKRRVFLRDGKLVDVSEEFHHIDTSCYWFLPGSFHLLHYWVIMPTGMSPECDRIFYRMIGEQSLTIRETKEVTVNFTSNYETHYQCLDIPPPPNAKRGTDLTTVYAQIRQLDPRQHELIRRRCGFDLLPLIQTISGSTSRNNLCFCGSGKRFKHCHGMLHES